jgi:hypothetical protein
MKHRDLVRFPPVQGFAIPAWLEESRILEIIDALNRGAQDDSDDSDDSDNE